MIWYNKPKVILEAQKDDDDVESTDYTDLNDTGSDEPESDDAPEETSDEDTSDEPATDEDTPEEGDVEEPEGTEGDSTDYTVDSEDAEPDSDDTSDDTTSDESEDTEPEEPEEDESEKESNRRLHNDYQELYYSCKSIIARLSALSRNNVLVNQTIAQIISNISIIEKQLYEYLIFNFGKKKYSANLLSYNTFISALQLNVEMLRKINVLTPDLQNN